MLTRMYAIRINVLKWAASHICTASTSGLLAKQWPLTASLGIQTTEKLTEHGQACMVDAIRSLTVPAKVFQQCLRISVQTGIVMQHSTF
jgi:hypothetical protein